MLLSRKGVASLVVGIALVSSCCSHAQPERALSADGNRLTYLDAAEPFYPGLHVPKLTTPQWAGEPGVDAVVILSIDDMRDTGRYESFLRPILERLKRIDGRAPVSILANAVDPTEARLQTWLKEGLSIEVHTLAHPCPCLGKGDFAAAAATYHGCVDLLNRVPGNRPVAFRMPCCDSMNSPSPRFYSEIFNRVSPEGHFLTVDSSVMNVPTPKDPSLPRGLVLDRDGRERFRKYLPTQTNRMTRVSMESFATTIEDYPYPYVIGRLAWEFPAMVPSDWEAFNLLGPTNATLLADWKSALDATVIKQGVFTFIFHPHGWSSSAQFVEFIDYATQRHGKKVKFLTFREAQERLDRNLLAGVPLRGADGEDNGVRLMDLNNDGYLDVLIGNSGKSATRVWNPQRMAWEERAGLPSPIVLRDSQNRIRDGGFGFGILGNVAQPIALRITKPAELLRGPAGAWRFTGDGWIEDKRLLQGLEDVGVSATGLQGDCGVRFRDVDRDGVCELIVGNAKHNAVFGWNAALNAWKKLPYALPAGASIVDAEGRDNGVRFVDINDDGYDDVLHSNEKEFSLHLFVPKANPRLMWEVGWNDVVFRGKRRESSLNIPMIVRGGTSRNNGVWFANKTMWVQNEDTAHLPDKVDRRTFRQLLDADEPQAMSPQDSLAAMRVRPGFKVELVAAEPLIVDPIAFDWGADGRLWVVEMKDYPLGKNNNGKPGGRIKILEDLDGDGRYDKAMVFLDDVNFPTGLMPWRSGVLVAAAPEIFHAEDTNGDGQADKRETILTGFAEGNQQHRLNGFDYGLDNWIYGANGDSGGKVRAASKQGSSTDIRGRDFRFRPDTGQFEAIEGQTQFGRHRDDWGNWFGNNNPNWLWHYHLPERYLARNSHLKIKSLTQMLANYAESTRLYPASRTRQRFNDHHQFNHVTSANSAMPYRDELFGPNFETSVFISDPVHNLVHREVLEPNGVTFTSRRAPDESKSEFLASADNWFRPIMLKTGPEGALYVADMYRQVLEHPEWIPAHIKPRLDLRAGHDKGRIYRVYPEKAALRRIPRLDQLNTPGLVAALGSPNGWERDTAHRLLMHRADRSAAEPLRRSLETHPRAKTRLHALNALDGLGELKREDVVRAWKDTHAEVRSHGIRLGEPLGKDFASQLNSVRGLPEFQSLLNDPSLRVRYQLAFSLGEWEGPASGVLLAELALRDFNQPEMRTAILSSAPRHVNEMLRQVVAKHDAAPEGLLEQLLTLAAAMKKDDVIADALAEVARPSAGGVFEAWQYAALASFLDAMDGRGLTFENLARDATPTLRESLRRCEGIFVEASQVVTNASHPAALRLAATRVMGRLAERRNDDFKQLGGLLNPASSSALQQAAVSALKRSRESAAADVLLAGWKGHSPAIREEVLAALIGRSEWTKRLLGQVENEAVPARQIGAAWQQKLLQHQDASIRGRAMKLFSATQADRQALLKDYAVVATLTGDAQRGLGLFRQHCAQCHRLGGDGRAVGPDLASITDKSIPALLAAILDPNQALESKYVSYTAMTRDDREVSGIIAVETANSITLRMTDGREETLLRSELKEFTSSGLSLMPEGFEKALKAQDMADLIATVLGR